MFEREHHQRIAALLNRLDEQSLLRCRCLFGGGTAIALAHGEFRESIDIDFICSSIDGYRHIRQRLADQYNLGNNEPNIQVWSVDLQGDRALTLRHTAYQRRPLNEQTDEVLKHVARLWGFDVRLETVDEHGAVTSVRERKWEKRNRI